MTQRSSIVLPLLLLMSLTGCEIFAPATYKSPATTARRPTTTAKRPATAGAKTLKRVDTQTYERSYARTVVSVARQYTGTPYRSGGNSFDGIDCSGLLYAAYSTAGLQIPRISWQQSEFGHEVEVNEILPGDWLFFVPDKGKAGYVSHTGLVTEVRGKNDIAFIHASSSRGVREDNLYSEYFKGRFVKAVRPF
ncbi:MAG: C40 family peptidase [Bacteroidetes bacterium]|nr:C40 family peptidase [Fibrella sp.]